MTYTQPHGYPQHWRYSPDEALVEAIKAYLEREPMSRPQQQIVVEYVRYYVNAPANGSTELVVVLRSQAEQARSLDDISQIIQAAQRAGIMPL